MTNFKISQTKRLLSSVLCQSVFVSVRLVDSAGFSIPSVDHILHEDDLQAIYYRAMQILEYLRLYQNDNSRK